MFWGCWQKHFIKYYVSSLSLMIGALVFCECADTQVPGQLYHPEPITPFTDTNAEINVWSQRKFIFSTIPFIKMHFLGCVLSRQSLPVAHEFAQTYQDENGKKGASWRMYLRINNERSHPLEWENSPTGGNLTK